MKMSIEKKIFKQGNVKYYFSSRFFLGQMRRDIFRLYSFFQVAKDYVRQPIPEKHEFTKLKNLWAKYKDDDDFSVNHQKGDSINLRVIKNIIHLYRRYKFEPQWIESFFDSMQADIEKRKYKTLDETLWYLHGSAEVVGLMLAQILNLPKEASKIALLEARAIQYINFIRDIEEDANSGRCYFPREDLKTFGLHDLTRVHVTVNPQNYKDFIVYQINRYQNWQQAANKGFSYIPRRIRIPLKTAIDLCQWTAAEIISDPFAVYHRKIVPKRHHVVRRTLKHMVLPHQLQ
jgi:phytoene synthase